MKPLYDEQTPHEKLMFEELRNLEQNFNILCSGITYLTKKLDEIDRKIK